MAVAAALAAIEGSIDGRLNFHLDAENDVLYLMRPEYREGPNYGEETSDGFTLMLAPDGTPAGITVVNYWRDFGSGPLDSASMRTIRERIQSWASRYFNHPNSSQT